MFCRSTSVGLRLLRIGTRRPTTPSWTSRSFRGDSIPSSVGASFSSRSSASEDCTVTAYSVGCTRSNTFSIGQGIYDADLKNPLQTLGPKGAYEVKKVDEGLFLRMEMPGIETDGLNISFDGDVVCVKGHGNKENHEQVGREYSVRIKFPSHEFKNNQKVQVDMRSGVLRMLIPDKFEDIQIEGNKEGIDDEIGPADNVSIEKMYTEVGELQQLLFAELLRNENMYAEARRQQKNLFAELLRTQKMYAEIREQQETAFLKTQKMYDEVRGQQGSVIFNAHKMCSEVKDLQKYENLKTQKNYAEVRELQQILSAKLLKNEHMCAEVQKQQETERLKTQKIHAEVQELQQRISAQLLKNEQMCGEVQKQQETVFSKRDKVRETGRLPEALEINEDIIGMCFVVLLNLYCLL